MLSIKAVSLNFKLKSNNEHLRARIKLPFKRQSLPLLLKIAYETWWFYLKIK